MILEPAGGGGVALVPGDPGALEADAASGPAPATPAAARTAAAQQSAALGRIGDQLQGASSQAQGQATAAWATYQAAATTTAAKVTAASSKGKSLLERLGDDNDNYGYGLTPLGVGLLVPLGRAATAWRWRTPGWSPTRTSASRWPPCGSWPSKRSTT